MHDLEPLMTYADVAALTSVHPRSLRREVLAGRLKPIVLGERTVRFEPDEVRAWLERAKTETAKALGAVHDDGAVHSRLANVVPYGSTSRRRHRRAS